MTASENGKVFDALMIGKILTEDAIALEKAGRQSGYKPGTLRGYLRKIDGAINLIVQKP